MRPLFTVPLILLATSLPPLHAQGITANMGMISGGVLGGASVDVRNLPYALEQITNRVQTLADGSHITSTQREKRFRDADGRTRTENYTEIEGQSVLQSVRLLDPNTRTSVFMIVGARQAQVMHLPEPKPLPPEQQAHRTELRAKAQARQAAANSGTPDAQASTAGANRLSHTETETLPPRTIAGVYAEGRRSVHIIPAGMIGNDHELRSTSEVWTSPDLHLDLDRTIDGSQEGKIATVVITLERAQPDPVLFVVPSDYKVTNHPTPFQN